MNKNREWEYPVQRGDKKRTASASDTIRTHNRGLVLDAIRRLGPLARTKLAEETGLSHATLTAISTDMIAQSVLVDLTEARPDLKTRGRPAVRLGFHRAAGYAILIEIDVNRARCSLIDYAGTLVDRVESALNPNSFLDVPPADFLIAAIAHIMGRNQTEAGRILRIAASVQGILERNGTGLKWSPVAHLAGHNLVRDVQRRFQLPMMVFKRGRLLAEGAHWLFPHLHDANAATVFIGSTVAMGLSFHGRNVGRSEDAATEFGHMNHVPNGALCRCGMRGCIEAYASDYAVLRSAFGLPDKTAPAAFVPASEYDRLIDLALGGDRNAVHAFNLAGNAIGFGLNRLMSAFDPEHVVVTGPGARAFGLMQGELEAALSASLIAREFGTPQFITHADERELVFKGLAIKTLSDLDLTDFAQLPSNHHPAGGQ
jgi:predicted NBD/HSP70 family sugar kinase